MTAVSAPMQAAGADEARGHFFGSKWEYRRILWGAMFALIVTLGLHRFTVTTNIRRYLWSRTDLAGEQLDYTGDALELLLGFLVLVVVLGPLLVVAAIIGWTVGQEIRQVPFAPLLMLVPLAILALYQARRYRLSHTVFRGLRFRQTGSAWLFFLLVLLWSAIVMLTLGLAYPWARASVERYKMRNTYYGDVQGSFVGSGWGLFKRGLIAWIAWLIVAIGVPLLIGNAIDEPGQSEEDALVVALFIFTWLVLLLMVFYPIFRAIVVRWRVAGMRFGALSFESNFSTWGFVKPYLKFYAWMVLLATVVGFSSFAIQSLIVPRLSFEQSIAVEIVGVVLLMIAYFSIATIIAFAFQGTVRFETWRLIVNSLVLRGIDQLDRAKAPAGSFERRGGRIGAALNLGGF